LKESDRVYIEKFNSLIGQRVVSIGNIMNQGRLAIKLEDGTVLTGPVKDSIAKNYTPLENK